MYLIILLVFVVALALGSVLLVVLIRLSRPKNEQKPVDRQNPAIAVPRPAEKKFKRCPVCRSTYTDDSLNYCLSDGSILEGANDEAETIVRRFK